jgi:protein-S-isoprenylcysteine O-methyltransferase Ste14
MNALESKIPPPIVMLIVATAMKAVSSMTPALRAPGAAATRAAWTLAAVALLVELAAATTMVRARTTVDPTHPGRASRLVATGIFRFTRNPIYLGDFLLLLAWAAYLASPVAAVLAPLFVAYIDRFQIGPEERALSELFGDAYRDYQARVGRWL